MEPVSKHRSKAFLLHLDLSLRKRNSRKIQKQSLLIGENWFIDMRQSVKSTKDLNAEREKIDSDFEFKDEAKIEVILRSFNSKLPP